MANARCPRCDAEALYVGLSELECPTAECPNFRGGAGERATRARASAEPGEQLSFELDLAAYGLWTPIDAPP